MDYGQAASDCQEDNDRVRVTEWRLAPGTATGHHVHEYDYVVVPVQPGTLTIAADDGGTVQAPLRAGVSYFRKAGVSHNVINAGETEIVFIEVEIK
ncbi:cupin domain-containing protein [Actibacterium sp. MT2.3-13A]|uniref:cupin domain-containing protein n=1 Tax=Actibacterium sp. MT2.3-13A TaxID=2828332 RepID=UPI001BA78947|nr:cupin domain-containing protein [Actibacterium sp. MT2.3-13A]